MAAYSAYRHVELDKIGFGKRSRSIMKPPGGECHDLFGADFHGTPSHQRVLKPPGGGTSELFASPPDQADSPRKARAPVMTLPLGDSSPIAESDVPVYKPGNDSHSRLFGPPDPPKYRQPPSSNILGLPIAQAQPQEVTPANETENIAEVSEQAETNIEVTDNADSNIAPRVTRNCVTGEGCPPIKTIIRHPQIQGGNPVTGEGYESPKSNGSNSQLNGASNAAVRNRVPPGGFSSGLW